jgi:hypothetical protein
MSMNFFNKIAITRSLAVSLVFACLTLIGGVAAANQAFPVLDGLMHQGVATCSSSMCHGSVKEYKNSNILHNEYITWDRKDIHSLAHNKLLKKEFKDITDKLGLKSPDKEPVCLNCHSSNVPEKFQGKKFLMSDGIGCETCHGGAEKWLASHTDKNATHESNLKDGLYPLDNLVSRARLCMSCHYGNENQFVTHEIMGAGHPRISFELDTFTELQPPHFVQDDDYVKRKTGYSNVKTWAIGQAVAAESLLEMLLSDSFHAAGLFPELSLFDCHSCHHPMSDKTWEARRGSGLGPGVVPINDSSLLMFRHVVRQVKPDVGWRMKKMIKSLHASSNTSYEDMIEQAQALLDIMPKLRESILGHEFTAKDISEIISSLVNEGVWGEYQDYVTAEQCVMAISALTISWDKIKPLTAQQSSKLSSNIDELYNIVADEENYDQSRFREVLKQLREDL